MGGENGGQQAIGVQHETGQTVVVDQPRPCEIVTPPLGANALQASGEVNDDPNAFRQQVVRRRRLSVVIGFSFYVGFRGRHVHPSMVGGKPCQPFARPLL